MSWLDLQLMFKQFLSGSSELSAWLDTVARAVINVFQQPAPPPPDKDRYVVKIHTNFRHFCMQKQIEYSGMHAKIAYVLLEKSKYRDIFLKSVH